MGVLLQEVMLDLPCEVISQAVRQFDDFALVEHDRHFTFDRQHPAAGFSHGLQSFDADGGDVEPHVLLRFGDFDDREPAAAAEGAGAADGGVKAFGGGVAFLSAVLVGDVAGGRGRAFGGEFVEGGLDGIGSPANGQAGLNGFGIFE